jgi:hypothetical protein
MILEGSRGNGSIYWLVVAGEGETGAAEFLATTVFDCDPTGGICAMATSRIPTKSFQSRFETGSDGGSGRRSKFKKSFALLHALAAVHQQARKMHVICGVTVAVLHFDQIPRSAFWSRENHPPVANRLHRRP